MIFSESPSLPVPNGEQRENQKPPESEDILTPQDKEEIERIVNEMTIDPTEEHLERLKQKLAENPDAADIQAVLESEISNAEEKAIYEMLDQRRADKEAIEEILASSSLENASAAEIEAKIQELRQKIDPANFAEIERLLVDGRDYLTPGIIIALFALKGAENGGGTKEGESASILAVGLKNYLGWPEETLPFAEAGKTTLGLLAALLLINSIALGDWMQKYGKRELRRMHLPRGLLL